MKEAVVDASVAVKWVVEEAHSDKAVLLLAYDARHAPDHWLAEAVNLLWAKVARGDLGAADAEERMAALLRAPVGGKPIVPLMPRAFAISVARGVTVYDALYVALAKVLDVPLVTADARLIRSLSRHAELARRVVSVAGLVA